MQIETVAEYAQDTESLKQLQAIGVDWAQGYFTGAPRRLSELLDELAAGESPATADRLKALPDPLPA